MRTTILVVFSLLMAGIIFGLVGCASGPVEDNVPRPPAKYNDQDDRDQH